MNLQSWVYGRGDDEPAPLEECLSRSTSGFGLLWRDATPLRRRATFLTVARALDTGGYTAVYDGGGMMSYDPVTIDRCTFSGNSAAM